LRGEAEAICLIKTILETVSAILIKAADYGESDKLVWLLTAECGVIAARLRGVKKKGAKLKYAAQPFCFGRYQLVKKGGFYTVTGCDVNDGFYSVSVDPDRYMYGCLMLETAYEAARYGGDTGFLAVLLNGLKMLVYSEASPQAALTAYLLDLADKCGYGLRRGDNLSIGYIINHLQNKLQVKFNAYQTLD